MLRRSLLLALAVFTLPGVAPVYAEARWPAYIISLPEAAPDVFIADADAAMIYRYSRTENGVERAQQSYISVGQRGMGKERSGDRRTPLGIYFIVDQLDTSKLHEKYGVMAFPLDYPNVLDRQRERTGDGIWVHGVLAGGGQRPPLDTDGCIALPNNELAALEKYFVPLSTPVVVTREIEWVDAETVASLREQLTSAVSTWAMSRGSGDMHAYLSLYAEDFSYRGMKLAEWASLRVQNFAVRGPMQIEIDDLLLLGDPEEEGLYLSRFQETSYAGDKVSRRIKRLYWRQSESGDWQIVAEDNG